jgi:chorismate lyase/3-hydroxybenzoate synthase
VHAARRPIAQPGHPVSTLHVSHSQDAAALAQFRFGAGGGDAIAIACAPLAGPSLPESWHADGASERGADAHSSWRRNGDFTLLQITVPEHDGAIEAASVDAYRRLMRSVRSSQHPFLLRIWNYMDAINAGDGDAERYRRFCVGRAAAVDDLFHAPPPAATAIGHAQATGTLQLIALCSHTPGVALENPRQTPAWQYPREFGPVSPGFSRGVLIGEDDDQRLLASGTASIVGHVSQHLGDAVAQTHESLANLEVLLAEGTRQGERRFDLQRCEALRVYLRSPRDLAAVQAALAERLALDRVLFVQGDVCRRELLVELEGVFASG